MICVIEGSAQYVLKFITRTNYINFMKKVRPSDFVLSKIIELVCIFVIGYMNWSYKLYLITICEMEAKCYRLCADCE